MQKTTGEILQENLTLTKKYFWRVLGLMIFIIFVSTIFSLIPGLGIFLRTAVSTVLSMGLFMGLRSEHNSPSQDPDFSLLDQISKYAFKKEVWIQYLVFTLAATGLILLGLIPACLLLIARIVSLQVGYDVNSIIEIAKSIDPVFIGAGLWIVLYFGLVVFPACTFSFQLLVTKNEKNVFAAMKKSTISIYQNWLVLLNLTIILSAPFLFIGALFTASYLFAEMRVLLMVLGSLITFISLFFILPFTTCLQVILFQDFFVPISVAATLVSGSEA